jgi:hypothetical protein
MPVPAVVHRGTVATSGELLSAHTLPSATRANAPPLPALTDPCRHDTSPTPSAPTREAVAFQRGQFDE